MASRQISGTKKIGQSDRNPRGCHLEFQLYPRSSDTYRPPIFFAIRNEISERLDHELASSVGHMRRCLRKLLKNAAGQKYSFRRKTIILYFVAARITSTFGAHPIPVGTGAT